MPTFTHRSIELGKNLITPHRMAGFRPGPVVTLTPCPPPRTNTQEPSVVSPSLHGPLPTSPVHARRDFVRGRAVSLAILVLFLAIDQDSAASDWPQFLGPDRNGITHDDRLIGAYPNGGPAILWKKEIGAGWAAPIVVGDRVLLFDRQDRVERLRSFEATTGDEKWKSEYTTAYEDDFGFDEGPRGTPAVADDRVYTFGVEGALNCWEFGTGKNVWSVDTRARFGQNKGFFGMACSPLIEGDTVIVNIGGDNAGTVAFNRASGKTVWQATSDEAGYSSPVAATINGKRYILALTRAGLNAIDPKTGAVYFRFPFHASISASVNAATPVVVKDDIFLSASYQAGAALLMFHEAGPEKLWAGDDILSNHYATSVYHDGYLYGFDGRQERGQHLRCIDFQTGKIRWSKDDFGAGTLILVDRPTAPVLLILSEKGDFVEVAATPDGYEELGRKQLVGFETRANAALSNGLYFARGKKELVCVDLRQPAPPAPATAPATAPAAPPAKP